MRGRSRRESARVCQHGAAVRLDAREQPVGTLPVERHPRQRRDGVGWGEPRCSAHALHLHGGPALQLTLMFAARAEVKDVAPT